MRIQFIWEIYVYGKKNNDKNKMNSIPPPPSSYPPIPSTKTMTLNFSHFQFVSINCFVQLSLIASVDYFSFQICPK